MADRSTGTGGGAGGRISHYFGQHDYQQTYQQTNPQYYNYPQAGAAAPATAYPQHRPHTVPPPQTNPYDRPPMAIPEQSIPGAFPATVGTQVMAPYPPTVNPTRTMYTCDVCNTDLTHRPRIRCIQCPNFDLCTTCYLTRRTVSHHESWHSQQTVLPPTSPLRHQKNPQAIFNCDVCHFDISTSPRARCLECVNFDLCADCHVMKVSTEPRPDGLGGHLPTHKMNVITNWEPETREKLVNDDYYPSNLYLDMIDAIFNFIHKNYHPPPLQSSATSHSDTASSSTVSTTSSGGSTTSTGSGSTALSFFGLGRSSSKSRHHRRRSSVTDRSAPGGPSGGPTEGTLITSASSPTSSSTAIPRELRVTHELLDSHKLALFYRSMGMRDSDNQYLRSLHNSNGSRTLTTLYSRFGLEYHLIPSPSLRQSLSDRVFPWQIDHVDTTPTEPALTRAGFRRSFVLGTFLNPEGTHFILQNCLSTGGLVNPLTGVVFRSWVPRDTLPRRPLETLVLWEKGLALGR